MCGRMVVSPSAFVYVRHMPADAEVPETSTTSPRRVAYTPAEFAQITGLKADQVRRQIRLGEIKAVKVGGLYCISRTEVERLFGVSA